MTSWHGRSANEADRIRHYLSAQQPHLLKAYDADFLVELIRQKQVQHRSRNAGAPARNFDWSQARIRRARRLSLATRSRLRPDRGLARTA